jgi:LmbE family N-acetylglucosaminyl deacetylase
MTEDDLSTRHTTTAAVAALALASAAMVCAEEGLRVDRGASGTWQKLLKLKTTASLLHTTAHPDDEHGGVLTQLSRGDGARVALVSLTRGESGDNAIGSELFDALGLIRTEELLVATEYYGVDELYFSTLTDYGFSKSLEEALRKWGKDAVLRDLVRVIRMSRPFVVVSRFQGTERDGHGHHQAAGLVSQEAFDRAGDPGAFPEQIEAGLRPWRPLKLYIGGVRENEDWAVRTNAGQYSPWLGSSYQDLANLGLSYQRSQTAGRRRETAGDVFAYYARVKSHVEATAKEESFFDGIDTSLTGLFSALGQPEPAGAREALGAIETEVDAALAAYRLENPEAAVPALARGLAATRAAVKILAGEPEAVFVLARKKLQFQDAINTALGLTFSARARPGDFEDPTGPYAQYMPPPTMEAVTPGQSFVVRTRLVNPSGVAVDLEQISLEAGTGWSIEERGETPSTTLGGNEAQTRDFAITLADGVALSRPYFTRPSIQQPAYDLLDPGLFGQPAQSPAAVAVARYRVEGVEVALRQVVTRREARLPYGYETRELMVVPEIGVRVEPAIAIVPLAAPEKHVTIEVGMVNGWHGEIEGELTLRLPEGWTSEPASHAFRFGQAGERAEFAFTVGIPSVEDRDYQIRAVARARGKEFTLGYDVIEHRDLETRYLYHPAVATVRGIDVEVVPGLRVGYVMGVGDQVPAGIAQLGAEVELLDEAALATGDLSRFDAIVTGTRAYAVREDLRTYNRRLLDYARDGGNLVVLYNTQEMVPNQHAPFPGELPRSAEEVSEEDSPMTILAPEHPVLNWPNAITLADFDGWVEQRGSKWWSTWDPAYTALLETHDTGQEPQQGGWLYAPYGKGHYSYFAYAMHRQLPFGVPGAYRLFANVLALGKNPSGAGEDR